MVEKKIGVNMNWWSWKS